MLPSTAPNPDLRVVAVALHTRPTSLAVPGFPPTTVPTPAPVPEPVLPSPPVAADAAVVLLSAGMSPADLQSAVPHGGGRGARGGPLASVAVAPAPARVPRGGPALADALLPPGARRPRPAPPRRPALLLRGGQAAPADRVPRFARPPLLSIFLYYSSPRICFTEDWQFLSC